MINEKYQNVTIGESKSYTVINNGTLRLLSSLRSKDGRGGRMSKEEAIEILSEMRSEYNLFGDEEEATRYHVLSWAIRAMNAEPVRHGRWIKRSKVYPDFPYDSTYNYECSNCGYMDTHGANVEVPYCWHCGAMMDEVEDANK